MQIDISVLLSVFGMLISAGGFGVTIYTVVKSNAKNEANRAAEMATLHTEIKHLSDRVDKHNNVVERTFELEGAVRENQHDITELKTDTREIKNKLLNLTRR